MFKERGNRALHFLDRYAGIPLIALGRLRHKRPFPSKIATIGLLRSVAIGDTVLISAIIADLRMAFPRTQLIFFAGPGNYEMACLLEGVDRVVKVPIRDVVAGVRAVRSAAVDVMIDFGSWARLEALLILLSKSAFTIGFRTAGQHRHYGYDLVVDHSSCVHELENYRRLARALGVNCQNAPRVPVAAAQSQEALREYAVFHPWPGGKRKELKQWPSEKWVRLIEELARVGMNVVLTGAPEDREGNDGLIAQLSQETQAQTRSAAGASLRETAVTLLGASLVVSVNTGVMHLAAALGTPLVALHGPTSSKRWGPICKRATVIDSPAQGCGYLNLGWEYPSRPPECMKCIPYERVRDACFEVLRQAPVSRHLETRIANKTNA